MVWGGGPGRTGRGRRGLIPCKSSSPGEQVRAQVQGVPIALEAVGSDSSKRVRGWMVEGLPEAVGAAILDGLGLDVG